MTFQATKQHVANRGIAPDDFLVLLVAWGRGVPESLFAPNDASDIYSNVKNVLGPWDSNFHRKAVMLEVMRVLGGFESTWNWTEGRDINNAHSITPETIEAGLWQVSANSMYFGQELKDLVLFHSSTLDPNVFQLSMKRDKALAMTYIASLLRRTVHHNGPVLRHEIDPWLRRDSVAEFQRLLS